MMQIADILKQIDLGVLALPEFQRAYVWNQLQIRELWQSLYRGYPVGSLLLWKTPVDAVTLRGESPNAGVVDLILDGQQRVTTLYGVMRGEPPPFFVGNRRLFAGLHFHVEREEFRFIKERAPDSSGLWVDVTDIFINGLAAPLTRFATNGDHQRLPRYIERLNRLFTIPLQSLNTETVSGEDKTLDVVVEIFHRVNTAGTKLPKGDLALARLCVAWPEARAALREVLDHLRSRGFEFTLDWLLRAVTVYVTGKAEFDGLANVTPAQFKDGIAAVQQRADCYLDLLADRLRINHDRVLSTRMTLPVLMRTAPPTAPAEIQQFLYWQLQAGLWGRYTGATDSTINQDLRAAARTEQPFAALIEQLTAWRSDLTVRDDAFDLSGIVARVYQLLYVLSHNCGARDLMPQGDVLRTLSGESTPELAWIFDASDHPGQNYGRAELQAIANFVFLSPPARQQREAYSGRRAEWLAALAAADPELLDSQWIPRDPELWQPGRLPEFLAARRELLAAAANRLFAQLQHGTFEPIGEATGPIGKPSEPEEVKELMNMNQWVTEQGLPAGELFMELRDQYGRLRTVIDLAWPDGLQQGLSQPVALLLNEPAEVLAVVSQAGYRCFTSVTELATYIEFTVLAREAA